MRIMDAMAESTDVQAVIEGVAAEVRALAAKKRISQGVIAERLGRSQSSVSARMTGKRAFTLPELVEVAALLGVDVREFFTTTPSDSRAA